MGETSILTDMGNLLVGLLAIGVEFVRTFTTVQPIRALISIMIGMVFLNRFAKGFFPKLQFKRKLKSQPTFFEEVADMEEILEH